MGNLLSQIESLFRRDFEDRDLKSTIASLSPQDKATVKAALVNKISTLKDSDLTARGFGSAIGGSIAGGAASAVVGNLLSEIEGLFRREEYAALHLAVSAESSCSFFILISDLLLVASHWARVLELRLPVRSALLLQEVPHQDSLATFSVRSKSCSVAQTSPNLPLVALAVRLEELLLGSFGSCSLLALVSQTDWFLS